MKLKSVNEKCEWLLKLMSQSTTQFKKTKLIKEKSDFFDQELENMRKEKNKLYKTAQYSNDSISASTNWKIYRSYKNDYKNLIQKKKFECNQVKINRANGDMKRTWKVLNSILNKENCEITCIKDGENIYEQDEIIAEKIQ